MPVVTGDAVHEAVILLQRYTNEITRAAESVLGAGAGYTLDVGSLVTLHEHPRSSPSDLERRLRCPRSTLARSLARLVDAGVVERHVNAVDRRRTELVLTRRGRRTIVRMNDVLDAYYREGERLAKGVIQLTGREPRLPAGASSETALEVAAGLSRAGRAPMEGSERAARPFGAEGWMERCALVLVARSDSRPSQLADALLLTPTGTSSLLDRLADRGLVERVLSGLPTDGRAVVVRTTPRGNRAADAIVAAYVPHLDDLVDALSRTIGRG
jgi:DNA-binding MarR family transcriptional regulator